MPYFTNGAGGGGGGGGGCKRGVGYVCVCGGGGVFNCKTLS